MDQMMEGLKMSTYNRRFGDRYSQIRIRELFNGVLDVGAVINPAGIATYPQTDDEFPAVPDEQRHLEGIEAYLRGLYGPEAQPET